MAPSVRTRKKEKTSNVAAEKSESDAPEPKTAEVTSFKAAAAEPQAAPSPPAPASLPPRWVPTTAVAILTAAAWPSLLVFSSLCLASMGHSLASEWTGNGIATISRTIDSKWELAALVGWRAYVVPYMSVVSLPATKRRLPARGDMERPEDRSGTMRSACRGRI